MQSKLLEFGVFHGGQGANRAERSDLGCRLQQCAFVQLVQLEEQRHGRRAVER